VLKVQTCSSDISTSSGGTPNTAFTFTSSDGTVTDEQFLVAPSAHSSLYTVGDDSGVSSAAWTSLSITSSTTSAMCIDHIEVDDEVWVGRTWLDAPCFGVSTDYPGDWMCATTFTWYRNNFDVQIHTCDISGAGKKKEWNGRGRHNSLPV
jgi:hypothetical protein